MKRWMSICTGLVLVLLLFWGIRIRSVTTEVTRSNIKDAINTNRYEDVIELSHRYLKQHAEDPGIWRFIGEAHEKLGQLDQAVKAYQQSEQLTSSNKTRLEAGIAISAIHMRRGELVLAEAKLNDVEKLDEENRIHATQMQRLLSTSGRIWESKPYCRKCLEYQVGDLLALMILLAEQRTFRAPSDDFLKVLKDNSDATSLLILAQIDQEAGEFESAKSLFERSLKLMPELNQTWVQSGELLLGTGDDQGLIEWESQLPKSAGVHPGIWSIRGRFAIKTGQKDAAIRCFAEVLKRNPDDAQACYLLSQQLLADETKKELGEKFLKRSQLLNELSTFAKDSPSQPAAMLMCAERCFHLGRIAEAGGWCDFFLSADPQNPDALALREKLNAAEFIHRPWQITEEYLAKLDSFDTLPTPEFLHKDSISNFEPSTADAFRFRDITDDAGLEFAFQNGKDPDRELTRMTEFTGGGVGVLDFDLDGWPDLYFTQGNRHWPPNVETNGDADILYQNQQGKQSVDVTLDSGIDQRHFGQGTSVGDFNNDGFPDLYVANFDGNRLLENNGDGTFSDVTTEVGLGHPLWTTSCLMADLNDDGYPDLYDTTFLLGENSVECVDAAGEYLSCHPLNFPSAPDVVWFNLGDGRFQQADESAGFGVPDGDGLGILAADFDADYSTDLFIANDGRPNFLFVRQTGQTAINWHEEAVISGLSVNQHGAAEACMGVASADINHDGLTDLFVTNFYDESNTLYLNQGNRFFVDATIQYGLQQPSEKWLGFGTQFFDADLNGDLDLIVVNGHVDDHRLTGKKIPYEMPPQFFVNRGDRFEELITETLGDWFAKEQLGRSLALLDWNRDGQADFAVSNLKTPANLILNETIAAGHYLKISVVGKTVDRDAVATQILVKTSAGQVFQQQFTAGSGYQASNEKVLILGLGKVEHPVTLEVIWPNGAKQTFANVDVDNEYIIVQGDKQIYPLAGRVSQ